MAEEVTKVEEKKSGVFIDKFPTIKTITANKENIEYLKRMGNYRPIRRDKVLEYLKVIERGESFAGMFVVNKVKDDRCIKGYKYVVIDGNHRLSAIIEYIQKHPEARLDLKTEVWDNLSIEEEKEVFIKYSTVLRIGQADKFHVKQKDCLFWRLYKEDNNFPCRISIHSSPDTVLRLSAVVMGYISRSSYCKSNWVEPALKLNENDFNSIKQLLTDLVAVFGKPSRGNHWFGQIPFVALTKVYYANVNRLGRTEITKRLQRKVQSDTALKMEMVHFKAGGSLKMLVNIILDRVNSGYSDVDKMFIGPGDIDDTKDENVINIPAGNKMYQETVVSLKK